MKIRSVLACETRRGICSLCYGRDLARGHHGQHRRSGRRDRGAVDRRAGYAAHDAYVPHRRRRSDSHRAVLARGAQRRHGQAQQRAARQAQGPLGRDEPPGRARPRRRHRSRARALRSAVRRPADGRGRHARQGRPAPRRVGPVRDADRRRGLRLREVRRHRRRRHHAGDARRGHRPVAQDDHRVQGRRTAVPRITLKDADGNTVKLPGSDDARPATSCRSARTCSSTTATTSRPAT